MAISVIYFGTPVTGTARDQLERMCVQNRAWLAQHNPARMTEDTLPEEPAVLCDYCMDSGSVSMGGAEVDCPYCGE